MTIRVEWEAPTKHTSGRPAAAGDLVGYVLSMRVEGAPDFTDIAEPAAEATSIDIDVSDPGLYQFELRARSSNGEVSAPGSAVVVIADDTPLEAPVVSARIL